MRKYLAYGGIFGVSIIALKFKFAEVDHPPFPAANGPLKPGVDYYHIAGFPVSPPTSHAHQLVALINKKNPQTTETWMYWTWFPYYKFLWQRFDNVNFAKIGAADHVGHGSSPFVWIERNPESAVAEGKKPLEILGGDDDFAAWAKKAFASDEEIVNFANQRWSFYYRLNQWYHAGSNPPSV